MKKSKETYLISFALVLLAVILLYEVYMTPKFSPAVIKKTEGTSAVTNTTHLDEENDIVIKNSKKKSNKYESNNNTSTNIVNINTAGVNELCKLPGIGEVKANAIIEYRENYGCFSSADDLTNVKGIGIKTVSKLRDKVRV